MFAAKLSWCQIVRCQIVLDQDSWCQIVRVPNCLFLLSWCQIVRCQIVLQSAHNMPKIQGGRSCVGARGAPAKKFGLGKNFKPQHMLFCHKLRFVAIFALFGVIWAKKRAFWGQNSISWARSALFPGIYCISH